MSGGNNGSCSVWSKKYGTLTYKTMLQYILSPQNGQTALMLAGDSGHADVVQLLLSSGAKIDMQNKVRHDINQ